MHFTSFVYCSAFTECLLGGKVPGSDARFYRSAAALRLSVLMRGGATLAHIDDGIAVGLQIHFGARHGREER